MVLETSDGHQFYNQREIKWHFKSCLPFPISVKQCYPYCLMRPVVLQFTLGGVSTRWKVTASPSTLFYTAGIFITRLPLWRNDCVVSNSGTSSWSHCHGLGRNGSRTGTDPGSCFAKSWITCPISDLLNWNLKMLCVCMSPWKVLA